MPTAIRSEYESKYRPIRMNIRQRGEDAVRGRPVLWEGSRVDAHRIAVLAAFGHAEVPVVRKPRVSILAGGDELRSVEDASPDVVVDSNSPMLAAMCKEAGAEPRCFGIAEDTAEGLEKKIVEALEGADVLLTVGGASVGERDLVRGVLAKLGMEEVFWKVALKPGKPVGFGRLDGKLIFMLPGNPGAAAITFDELMRPALIALQGGGELKRPRLHGRLKGPVKKQPGLSYLLRGKATMGNDGVEIEVLSRQGSGQITPPLACNAVAHLPRGAGSFEAGDEVEICLTGALPERSRPPLLSFVGTSNSGKTTVLCRLIERLSSDLRVGAIKSAHTFTMDREGKDTQRMRASGARAVGVASPTERACIVATEHPTRLAEMASTLPEELDIIVAEGFKRDRFTPKVEVHRKGNPFLFRGREIVNIVAIVTDEDDVPGELPRFRPEELDALERFVRDFIGQGEPPPKMEC